MTTKNADGARHGKSGVKNAKSRAGMNGSQNTGNPSGNRRPAGGGSASGTRRPPESAGQGGMRRPAGTGNQAGARRASQTGSQTAGRRPQSAGGQSGTRRAAEAANGAGTRRASTAGRSASAARYREEERYDRPGRTEGQRKPAGKKMSAKKRAAKRRNRIILFGVEILILVGMLGFLYTVLKTEKVEKIQIDEERVVMEMNESVEENEVMKGYRNIALFGVDSRNGSLGKGTRSDTIIIASINQDTGDVKLISVFRDTYLNLGNDTYNKCNAAYAKGGPEQAITMLNKNLDMNITDYITVGFDGLIEVIDALGGVEINVTEAEIPYLNDYQISMVGREVGRVGDIVNYEATEGKDYTAVTHGGLQTLNGLQATAYCRIRYIGNDFQRAQRQRDVLIAASEKAKGASISELNNIVNGVMGNISTSLDVKEILNVMKDLGNYSIVANDGFPFEQYRATGRVGSKGSCVIPQDLAVNVAELHRFLFDENDYQISSEVDEFSKKVSSDTGKYVNTSADEFTKKEKENDEVATSE